MNKYLLEDKMDKSKDVVVNTHCIIDSYGREVYIDVYSYLDYLLDIAKIEPTPVVNYTNYTKPKKKENILKKHARKFLCTFAVIFGIFLSSKLTPDMSTVNTGDEPVTNHTIENDNSNSSIKKTQQVHAKNVKTKKKLSSTKKSKLKIGNISKIKHSKVKKINLGSKLNLDNVDLRYTSLGGTPIINTRNISCDSYKINSMAVINNNKIKEVVNVNSNNNKHTLNDVKKKYKSKYGKNTSIKANVDGYKNGKLYFNNIGWTSFSKIAQHNKKLVKHR